MTDFFYGNRFAAYLVAVRELGLQGPSQESERAAVAEMLGLVAGKPRQRIGQSTEPTEPTIVQRKREFRERPQPSRPIETNQPAPDLTGQNDDGWLVERTMKSMGTLPPWYDGTKSLAKGKSEYYEPPRAEPILIPRWARAILTSALSTPQSSGEIDLQPLMDAIVRANPILQVPFLVRRRPAPGIQILCDRSDEMTPLFTDQDDLVDEIERNFSPNFMEVFSFVDCPLDGLPGRHQFERFPYPPPPPGTPVLILSSLGAHRYRKRGRNIIQEHKWIGFARLVRNAECFPIAFVPFELYRISPAIRRHIAVLPWGRRTTTGLAHRVFEMGTGQ